MKNQKSKRLNRKQIKRKTIKRKQNKKLAYNQQKLYGGDFNKKQQKDLKRLLKKNINLNFSDEELKDVMKKLNTISQVYLSNYPYYFNVLKTKIMVSTNKRGFTDWLEGECNDKYKGVTDDEDEDEDEDDNYDEDEDNW